MIDDLIGFSSVERLRQFFEQARPMLSSERHEAASAPAIDPERLSRFIVNLRAPLDSATTGACTNPWLTAGLGHDEVRISAVLAALWDRHRYGNEARAFLARFFARAGTDFPDEAELAEGYRVQTEHCLNGAVTERVDITVETRKSVIGIEVKIYAGEGENQLARYIAAIGARARLMRRDRYKIVFLSPYSSSAQSRQVAHVTWRAVGEIATQANDATAAGWLIGQFGEFCCSLGN